MLYPTINGVHKCPDDDCNSDNVRDYLDGDEPAIEEMALGHIFSSKQCGDCGKQWIVTYKATSIEFV